MLRHLRPMPLQSSLVLFWVDQKAGNVDEVETDCQE